MAERESWGLAGRRTLRWLAALWLCVTGGLAPASVAQGQGLPADTELAYFEVSSLENGIATLEWGTISEAGAVGFKIYRANALDGYRTPIVYTAAAGAPSTPTSYVVTDTLQAGTTTWYWLADVNVFGVEQALTTPISVATGLQPVDQPLTYRMYFPFVGN